MTSSPHLPPAASIVVPTRNRCDMLRDCLVAAGRQTVPVELIVVDDGSEDGTADMMHAEFPQAIYRRFDDDAVLVSPRTVEQTLAEFDGPRIGAVGIPFVNIRVGPRVLQRAPDDVQPWVQHTFVGAAHAVRRDAFLAVGGYREHFFYMGEEGDLTLRMLAAGWVTRLGQADPIEHHESPRRVTARADFCGRRNDVLFAMHNVPAIDLPVHLAGTVFNGLRAAIRSQHPIRQCAGLAVGLWQSVLQWMRGGRRPVSRNMYRLQRRLKKAGPRPLAEIESLLPQIES